MLLACLAAGFAGLWDVGEILWVGWRLEWKRGCGVVRKDVCVLYRSFELKD